MQDYLKLQTQPEEEMTWNDYALAFGSGLNRVASGAAGLVRTAADQLDSPITRSISRGAEDVGTFFRGESQELVENMSPAAQQRRSENIFTSDDPLAAFAIQGVEMLPTIGVSVLGGIGGAAGVGLATGALSVGQFADDTYNIIDNMPNDDLLTQSSDYADMIRQGMPEYDARRALSKKMIDENAAFLMTLGAVTGPIGVPGKVAGALGFKSATQQLVGNALQRGIKGAGIGMTTEAIQSGAEALAFEQAMVASGAQTEINTDNIIHAMETGAAFGTVLGGGADVVAGSSTARNEGEATVDPVTGEVTLSTMVLEPGPNVQVEVTPAVGPDSTVTAAINGVPIGEQAATPVPAEAANLNAPLQPSTPANVNELGRPYGGGPPTPPGRDPRLPQVNLPEAGPDWPYTEAAQMVAPETTTFNGRTYTRVGDKWVLAETAENAGYPPTTPTPQVAPTVTPVAPTPPVGAVPTPRAALDIGTEPTPQVLADRATVVEDLRASQVPDYRIVPDATGNALQVIATDGTGRVDFARAPNIETANQLGRMYVEQAAQPTATPQAIPEQSTATPQEAVPVGQPVRTPFTAAIEEVAAPPAPAVTARAPRGRKARAVTTGVTPALDTEAPAAVEAGVQAGVEAAAAGITPEQAAAQVGAQTAVLEEARPAARVRQKPGPKPQVVPTGPRPEGPQILPETYPGAKRKAQRIHAAGVRKQLAHEKLANRLERMAEGLEGSRNVSQEIAEFEAQNVRKAEEIVEEHIKETSTYPQTNEEFDAVIERLQKTVKAVADNEVTVPEHIRGVKQADAMVYLREVEDLVRDAKKKSFVGDYRRKRVTNFLADEIAARGGDYDPLRRSRRQRTEKVEGTGTKAGDEGPIPKAEMLAADITGKPDESFVPLTKSQTAGGAGLRSMAQQRTVTLTGGRKSQVEGAMAGETIEPPKITKKLQEHYRAMLAEKEAAQAVEEAKRSQAETPAEVRAAEAEAKKLKTHPILRISKRMGTNQRIRNAQRAYAAGVSIEEIADKTGFFPDYVREIVARPERKPTLPPVVTEPEPAPTEKAPRLAAVRKKAKTAAEKRAEAKAEQLIQNVVDRIDRLRADETIRDMKKRGLSAKEISQGTGYMQEAVQRVMDRPDISDRTSSTNEELAAEVAKVSKSKTPGQEAAENHKMGHVKYHGQPVSITHAKGETRNGGELKAHYGYIPGTESADRKPIDVYVGDNLKAVETYVIDQVNPDTKAFDEPKVMAGFDDQKQAVDAYQGSFGDGRGADRMGDVTPKNPDELAKWVKRRQTKPAGEPEEVTQALADEDQVPGNVTRGRLTSAEFGDPANRLQVLEKYSTIKTNFGEISQRMVTGMRKIPRPKNDKRHQATIAFIDRIQNMVKDVKVYVMPSHLYDLVSDFDSDAYYSVKHNHIVMRESAMANTDAAGQLVLHEGVHAAFIRATAHRPEVRAAVTEIANELKANLAKHDQKTARYAYMNVDEFIAEAFSNQSFQSLLGSTLASPKLQKLIAGKKKQLIGNRLQTLWANLKTVVADALNLSYSQENYTLLDRMMQVGGELEADVREGVIGSFDASDQALRTRVIEEAHLPGTPWMPYAEMNFDDQAPGMMSRVRDAITQPDLQPQNRRPWALKLRSNDFIARDSDRLGFVTKDGNPVRDVTDILEKTAVTSQRNLKKAQGVITNLFNAEKKYQGTPTFEEFAQLLHNETITGADASLPLAGQTHLSPWAKARHADLAKRYAALPSDLKVVRKEAMDFFRDQQNAMTLGLIKNRILKTMGIKDDALAQRVFDGDMTDADRTLIGEDLVDALESTKVLNKIKGPYFPLMRRGDSVVTGKYKVAAPKGAHRKISDNEYEFSGPNAEQMATNFATHEPSGEVRELKPTIKPIWVESTTGEQYVTENGKTVKITKNDINAERRYRVTIESNFLEFFDSDRKARKAAKELQDSGLIDVNGVETRRFEGKQIQNDMLSLGVQNLIKSIQDRPGFKAMTPDMQREIIRNLKEQSIRLLGATRVQSRRIPRRGVLGYSNNLTQNTMDYAVSTAGHLSRLEHQPALDDAVQKMNDLVRGDYTDDRTLSRSSIVAELNARIANGNGFSEGNKKYSPVVERLLVGSFINNLGSASYSVVNSTQVGMVTASILGGRHGYGKTFRAITKAYRDMGALGVLGKGLAATGRKIIKPGQEGASFFDDVMARVSKREGDMLQRLADVRAIDAESGMEVGNLSRYRGTETLGDQARRIGDTAISWTEGVVRELPKAIETINRTVTALASYRLEFSKNGGDHLAAVQYAQDMVNSTQFNYSSTNAPPLFNHPLWRVVTQFKKYPMFMYQLLGQQVGKAWRNQNPGDRAEAVKALMGLAASHTLAAGVLGLPIEPIKAFVMVVNAVTGGAMFSWQDVEDETRALAANLLGADLGEALTKGVTRALPFGMGFDLSSRMGLSDMLLYGSAESNDPADLRNWLIGMAGGPSSKLIEELLTGSQAVAAGEWTKAAENLLPIKAASDSIKAFRVATEGKKTESRRESLEPYGIGEALTRAFGFTPAREAERSAMQRSFLSQSGAYREERQEFEYDWAEASPNERARLWGKIERWNQGQPKDARLTRQGLESYRKRRETDLRKGNYAKGLQINKGTRDLYERLQPVYNQ